jgi:hypothetical protein
MMGRGLLIESRYYPVRRERMCGVVDKVRGGMPWTVYQYSVPAWQGTVRLAWLLDRGWRKLPLHQRQRIIRENGWWSEHRKVELSWSQRTPSGADQSPRSRTARSRGRAGRATSGHGHGAASGSTS